jgi:hypothetical protein
MTAPVVQPGSRLNDIARSSALVPWRSAALLLALGVVAGLMETRVPTIIGRVVSMLDGIHLAIGVLAVVVALAAANRFWCLPWRQPGFAIALAFVGCLVAGWLGGVSWPNSGDEYSYVFLADTLRAGRLTNPGPPDQELFETFHVLVEGGRKFSPYPPGWSAVLVPFRTIGAVWLANPLLTALVGIALMGAFRQLKVSPIVQKPALALVLLTPFTLFLGGSVFPQTMACALVACIVWVQLTDEAQPRLWRKLLIGALFGILVLTRYDVFAIVAVIYAIDRLALRRLHAVADALPVILGWLPYVACHMAYDFGVTGNPLQLTATWAAAGDPGLPGDTSFAIQLLFSAVKNLFWLGSLAQFGGLPVLILSTIALAVKIRRRSCRFYDFLLPAAVVFYSFVPFTGGHQYGPRYWFWAWPIAMLTITSGLVDGSGYFRIGGRRVALERFAAACLVYAAGAFCVLLVTTHFYIAARRAVLDGPLPDARAIVLLPSRSLRLWSWQDGGINAWSSDFTRNDLDYDGQVIFGRSDADDAIQRACRLDGRKVFQWEGQGPLVPMTCH